MRTALVTGGAGFFGTILCDALLQGGWRVVSVDFEDDARTHASYVSFRGNIADRPFMEDVFSTERYDVIFHLAAIISPHAFGEAFQWKSNVEGTRVVADLAAKYHVPKIVFLSTICLWGSGFDHPVVEDEPPTPIEPYGKSKWEAEKILRAHAKDVDSVILRCPPVLDAGRLGLLSILFEFIEEGRKVWVVGGGDNRYQFIYGADLVDACMRAAQYQGSGVFNIGSDSVKSFREVYEAVIRRAGTAARVVSLPRPLATFLMKIAYTLGLSPLGPYQTKMLAENFVFDTTKIREKLGWRPTLTNEDMLWKSYEYYQAHKHSLAPAQKASTPARAVKMGAIRVLKWIS